MVPHRVGVSVFHQGYGLAVKLFFHCEALAKENGISRIRVDTNIQNGIMQNLLGNKLKYTRVGELSLKQKPGQDFVGYEKILT